ncbi:hypothetical protein K491DRAFT_686139 [Lophiostoma macrostomum CBS 122681]|uniref:C2H2-type domain-containing protein n=1 Tax=Lophiostoma macrostomum CBS 122681 TaxID=1314788 RepID=A0A6A6TT85_9PLEO|nr:hypothetical protein K491DRAFT_686139 [Lophiostoma macrostomum CBS 122681]
MISPSNGQSASGLEHEYSESQSDGQHSRICSYCGLQFHGEWALRNVNRHIESKHPVAGPSITTENGEAVYRCGACDNKYRRKDARLKHERCRHPELQRPPAKPRRKPDEA